MTTTPKTTAKPEATKAPKTTISLGEICKELKVDPREARQKLRAAEAKKYPTIAAHKPKQPWEWPKGSDGEKECRALLKA